MSKQKSEKSANGLSFTVREEVSSYKDISAWQEDIIESFPRQTQCPICIKGQFQLSIQGAVANGVCSNCKTSIPYQFYDTRYLYIDNLAEHEPMKKRIAELEAENEWTVIETEADLPEIGKQVYLCYEPPAPIVERYKYGRS